MITFPSARRKHPNIPSTFDVSQTADSVAPRPRSRSELQFLYRRIALQELSIFCLNMQLNAFRVVAGERYR